MQLLLKVCCLRGGVCQPANAPPRKAPCWLAFAGPCLPAVLPWMPLPAERMSWRNLAEHPYCCWESICIALQDTLPSPAGSVISLGEGEMWKRILLPGIPYRERLLQLATVLRAPASVAGQTSPTAPIKGRRRCLQCRALAQLSTQQRCHQKPPPQAPDQHGRRFRFEGAHKLRPVCRHR